MIPHFEHAGLLPGVVAGLEQYGLPIIVVDDGSAADTRSQLGAMAEKSHDLQLVFRPSNGGKGAALKTGYRRAFELGFTHVLQVDAEGFDDQVIYHCALERSRPRVIHYEWVHLPGTRKSALESFLEERGYILADCGEDTLAILREYRGS